MSKSQADPDDSWDNLSLYLTPSQDLMGATGNEGQPGSEEGQDEGHDEDETTPGPDNDGGQPYQCIYIFYN